MSDQHISTSSQGSEDSQWQLPGLDIPPESSASRTNTAPKSSTDTGPMSQLSQTSETLTEHNGEEADYLQEDFLANLSVSQGSIEARKMTATSGRKCAALLRKQDPVGSLLKMLLESLKWHSTRCFLNWQACGTPAGFAYFQLAPSTPRTGGTEFGSSLIPTVAARDYKGARKPETMEKTGRNCETNSLPDLVEWRDGTNSRLSPQFAEEMMGYPTGFSALKPLETPLSRKWHMKF